MRVYFFTLFLYLCLGSYAQKSAQLFHKLKVATSDTQKINVLNALTKAYIDINLDSATLFNKQATAIASTNKNERYLYKSVADKAIIYRKKKQPDSALIVISKAMDLAKKYNNISDQANASNVTGLIYEQLNKTDLASENYMKALKLSSFIKDKKEMLSAYLHLGINYKKANKITEALSNLLEATRISEEIKDSSIIFTTCINLGSMYERTKDHDKAMTCYKKALFIVKHDAEKDENDLAICYFKIGKLFQNLKQSDSAKYYLMETLKIHLKRHDEVGLIFDYSNLASYDAEVGDFEAAEKNYRKALELGLKTKDSVRINLLYSYIGMMFRDKKDYNQGLKYLKTAMSYTTNLVSSETVMMQHKHMADIYMKQGKYKEALDSYIKYKALSDLSYNVNETRKQTELTLNYEFEKVQKKIEAETKAKELISKAELESEKKQRNYLLLGLAVISLMLVITIKNYNAKQKANHILQRQKREIEHQKRLVEEKNNEINDSINYAKRIQAASVPTDIELSRYFKNYGLFFRPKDVVSGDFYWSAQMNEYSLVAIADCTGHGVPGDITSMIGSMLLNEIFYVKHLFKPDEVLTELNRLVKLTLRQESDNQSNDGMDIAFCLLNNLTNELLFAGANRPLYVINPQSGMSEYKPTKMSVGGQVPLIQQYELNKIQLNPGETVVLSTDGYADQFGGENEKKFTSKAFRNLLLDSCHKTPQEQKQIIENAHNEWKGAHDQTDDVLVFIFKV